MCIRDRTYHVLMADTTSGHIEQLPGGTYRVHVYAGIDPLTRRQVYFRETAKTLTQAQIALGKLLGQAQDGRQPESGATVTQLLDQYAAIAEWELSTRAGFDSYIRRIIKPSLGHLQVRKVQGPILDLLYARLKKCGDLTCTGRPFTEHRNVPDLRPESSDKRVAWEQVAGKLGDAIAAGVLGGPEPGGLSEAADGHFREAACDPAGGRRCGDRRGAGAGDAPACSIPVAGSDHRCSAGRAVRGAGVRH